MNQKIYPPSDLESLLSKHNITEDDLPHLPELFLEEPKTLRTKPPSLTS